MQGLTGQSAMATETSTKHIMSPRPNLTNQRYQAFLIPILRHDV